MPASLTLAPPTLPNDTLNNAYDETVTASGGNGTYTYSLTGSLPNGLTLNTSTGEITGKPTATGTSSFTIDASDTASDTGSQNYSITINPAISFTTTSLPDATLDRTYTETIQATGGTGTLTYSAPAGTLPAGLTLASDGVLSGTPTATGTTTFTVTATDTANATDTQSLSLTVNPDITFTTTSLPGATVNTAYSEQITATGGTGTLSYAVTSGTLPTGLTLSPAGLLSGTPTTTGATSITVTATDTNGATTNQAYTLTVNPGITFTTTTLPGATVSTGYNQTITTTGGTTPIKFTLSSGTLPTGITLSTAGVLSGTPTATGTSDISVEATDANGATTTQALVLTVNPAITFTTTTLPNGTADTAYSQQISTTGGTSPVTFTVSTGTLPAGLNLSTSGAITGTPSTAGTSTFTVTATDNNGSTTSQDYSLTIDPAITFTTTSLPDGTVSTAYSQQITATGGSGTLNYAVTSGSLPSGLNLSSSGLVSGTPSTPGTSTFTVTATDTAGATANQVFTLTIDASTSGLTVTNLQRFGFHDQPTTFVLTFSGPLASGPAQTVSNYTLVPLVNGQVGLPITISSAVYDATNDTVTLTPAHNVYLYGQYQLTVNGTSPNGLTDTSGNFLAGANGTPGTNYVKTFGKEILAGPNIPSGTPTALANFINNEWTNDLASQFAALAAAAGDSSVAAADTADVSPARAADEVRAADRTADHATPAVATPTAVTPTSTATSDALTNAHPAAVDHVLAAIVLPDATDKKKS